MRHKLFLILTLIILSTAILTGCNSETTATDFSIEFHITDASGNPLEGAKVVSQAQPEGQLKISGITGSNGIVKFINIKSGDYNFYVNRFDYLQLEVGTTVTGDNTLELKMTRVPDTTTTTPITDVVPVTFSELTTQPEKYNGKFVTVEGFFFAGFEIVALAEKLIPATYTPQNFVPQQPLIWLAGGLPQDISDKLYVQTQNIPSGYPERFGKVRLTGKFEYGGKYGHMDAYQYRLTIYQAELLEWSPAEK